MSFPEHGGAASVAIAGVLTGPERTVTVLASLPTALYLATGDPSTPAVALLAADAVRVPCGFVLAPRALGPGVPCPGVPVPRAAVGSAARLGAGGVCVAGVRVTVTRWWRPCRPVLADVTQVTVSGTDVGQPDVDQPGTTRPDAERLGVAGEDLRRALATGGDLRPAVRGLLGLGPGLTPLGDDVLAGALVTLRAMRSPSASPLGKAVRAELAARPTTATTPVSAALLVHADRGECVPELGALLSGGDPAGVLAVGHTSGAGLLAGVAMALQSEGSVTRAAPHRATPGHLP